LCRVLAAASHDDEPRRADLMQRQIICGQIAAFVG